jgi:hypothetical protein
MTRTDPGVDTYASVMGSSKTDGWAANIGSVCLL